MKNPNKNIVIYQSEDGKVHLDVVYNEETMWLTQQQLCDLYQTSKSNVSEHIKHIFEDGELVREARGWPKSHLLRKQSLPECALAGIAGSKSRLLSRPLQIEGTRKVEREVEHYNLDMILSLGY